MHIYICKNMYESVPPAHIRYRTKSKLISENATKRKLTTRTTANQSNREFGQRFAEMNITEALDLLQRQTDRGRESHL